MNLFSGFLSITRPAFWARKSALALIDQGLFTGGNFILNILLARWLEPERYGAFVLAYSVFLFVSAFHTAIVTEPMTVFGAGKYLNQFEKYFGIVLFGQIGLAGLLIPLSLVAFILGHFYTSDVMNAMLWMCFVSPMILLVYVVRRGFYIRMQPGLAALSSGLNLGFLFTIVYVLWVMQYLSQNSAFLGMGLSAFLVSMLFVRILRPKWNRDGNPTVSVVASDHWQYGRWALATSLLIWLSGNFYYLILPAWIGLKEIAALRALLNLALPIVQTTAALSALFMPIMSEHFKQDGLSKLLKTSKIFLSLLLVASILFLLVLSAFQREILELLYNGRYTDYHYLVPLVGLLPVAGSFVATFGCAMRVMERPNKIFWSYVISTAVGLTVGLILAVNMGPKGALWGMLLSYITTGVMMQVFFTQLTRQWRFR